MAVGASHRSATTANLRLSVSPERSDEFRFEAFVDLCEIQQKYAPHEVHDHALRPFQTNVQAHAVNAWIQTRSLHSTGCNRIPAPKTAPV